MEDEFLAEHQDVVQHHPADDDDNHPDIERGDEGDDFATEVGLLHAIQVNFAGNELRVGSRMALPAGLREIGVVNGRARVTGWQDIVHSMTTGAIRNRSRTHLRRHAVVARQIRRDTVTGDAEFRRELYAGVTRCASSAYVARSHRRLRIIRRLDGMYAMAVGADRRLPVALGQRRPMDALYISCLHVGVALAARTGHVGLGNWRLRVRPGQYVMRSVAVGADGRVLRPAVDRLA